ncbi:hypothetical protein Tco_0583494 [Tanacetum coccineum]
MIKGLMISNTLLHIQRIDDPLSMINDPAHGISYGSQFRKEQSINESKNRKDEDKMTVKRGKKLIESELAKLRHVIAPGSSRNSSKESYGSNDMAHNYYLEEAKKKKQDKNRNLKPREMPSARTHHSPNICTPKPKSDNQTSKN